MFVLGSFIILFQFTLELYILISISEIHIQHVSMVTCNLYCRKYECLAAAADRWRHTDFSHWLSSNISYMQQRSTTASLRDLVCSMKSKIATYLILPSNVFINRSFLTDRTQCIRRYIGLSYYLKLLRHNNVKERKNKLVRNNSTK